MKQIFQKAMAFLRWGSFFFTMGILNHIVIGWIIYSNPNMVISQKALIIFLFSFFEGSISLLIYDFIINEDIFFIKKYKESQILENKDRIFQIVDFLLKENKFNRKNILSFVIITTTVVCLTGPFFSTLFFRKDNTYSFIGILGTGLKYILGTSLLIIPFRLLYIDSFIKMFLFFKNLIKMFIFFINSIQIS